MPDNVIDSEVSVTVPDPQRFIAAGNAMLKVAEAEERIAKASKTAAGAYESLERAQAKLQRALAKGDAPGSRVQDLQNAIEIAQRRVERAEKAAAKAPDKAAGGSTMQQRLARALYSTRFGSGNGLMPLVGRSIDAVGGEGAGMAFLSSEAGMAAGAVGILAMAAYAGGQKLNEMAEQASAAGRAFSAGRLSTGATTAEGGQISVLSSAFGVDIAGLSRSLNERITSNSFAMATAAQFGAYNIAGPYGKVDQAGNLLKVIEGLRHLSSESQIREARLLNIEGALPLMKIGNAQFQQLKSDAAITSRIMDPQFEKDAAEAGVAANRVTSGGDLVNTALSKHFLPRWTKILNSIANSQHGLANWINQNDDYYSIGDFIPVWLGGTMERGLKVRKLHPSSSFKSDTDSNNAQAAHTDAVERNTQALTLLSKGIVGGGDRIRSANLSGLQNIGASRAFEMHAAHFGPL